MIIDFIILIEKNILVAAIWDATVALAHPRRVKNCMLIN